MFLFSLPVYLFHKINNHNFFFRDAGCGQADVWSHRTSKDKDWQRTWPMGSSRQVWIRNIIFIFNNSCTLIEDHSFNQRFISVIGRGITHTVGVNESEMFFTIFVWMLVKKSYFLRFYSSKNLCWCFA